MVEDERFVGLIPIEGLLGSAPETPAAELVADGLSTLHPEDDAAFVALGLLGAMASSVLVGAFERELQETVLVAFFVPAVVYMADAVGIQTETVLIRGLAAGITTGSVLRRELITGAITGLAAGATFGAFAAPDKTPDLQPAALTPVA